MTSKAEVASSYINIKWQEGAVPEAGVNGAQIDDVIDAVLIRLRKLNKSVPCRENSITITKLEEAAMWQEKRTRDREERGVEGQQVA